jgi:putative intracellular protease/amidase
MVTGTTFLPTPTNAQLA